MSLMMYHPGLPGAGAQLWHLLLQRWQHHGMAIKAVLLPSTKTCSTTPQRNHHSGNTTIVKGSNKQTTIKHKQRERPTLGKTAKNCYERCKRMICETKSLQKMMANIKQTVVFRCILLGKHARMQTFKNLAYKLLSKQRKKLKTETLTIGVPTFLLGVLHAAFI